VRGDGRGRSEEGVAAFKGLDQEARLGAERQRVLGWHSLQCLSVLKSIHKHGAFTCIPTTIRQY
jgi:hypothetical protein